MLLNVVTTQVTEYEESIAYETETKNDSSMYQPVKLWKEKKGSKSRSFNQESQRIGKEREVISEEVIKKPVNKIIAKGTKLWWLPAQEAEGWHNLQRKNYPASAGAGAGCIKG